MRAAPPLAFTVSRYGVWRGALALLAALGAVTMTLWMAGADAPLPSWQALAAMAGTLLAAVPLLRSGSPGACVLRWDGQRWHLTARHGCESAGRLAVAIDLGSWLLLRFAVHAVDPQPSAWRRAKRRNATWIPLQRQGLEREWHAIRSTIHSTRPVPDGVADTPAR